VVWCFWSRQFSSTSLRPITG